ncbi:cupredoxin domain-containing protein [Thalassobius sp. S69A]|uniref:cupredoxin domain-containing protein n=1 Tax=unclassified Thalassovita TaxID=2619711 RepID=UPI000C0DD9A1|nr:copper-binding protein [Paracoccaceae bacterium]MBT25689.1 copper-binding protein [Paracoccaceae bacterium]|tara:strand:- start:218 stop:562 length:345 start_codon:yes stop_codon:yes gene_type:complete
MTHISRRQFGKIALSGLATVAAASAAGAADEAVVHNVAIKGMAFDPAVLTISAGDTVVFTNMDGAPHTATAKDGTFDTGRLNRNKQSALEFGSAGTYAYYCEIHPRMTGQIVVK